MSQSCMYCDDTTDKVIWSNDVCRVLFIDDAPFTGWCRVVWNAHLPELTDLSPAQRDTLMSVVYAVEEGIRKFLSPAKMNVASLGTLVPHLHWHIIPRYEDDSHYPEPVWAAPQRAGKVRPIPSDFVSRMQDHLDSAIGKK